MWTSVWVSNSVRIREFKKPATFPPFGVLAFEGMRPSALAHERVRGSCWPRADTVPTSL